MNKTYTFIALVVFFYTFSQCSEASREKRKQKIKQKQYFVQGQGLYKQHCSSCHQTDGSGLNKLIPPISVEYINNNPDLIICGIKYGISGPLQVGDILFNNKMPSNQRLSDIEIAEIMTFIESKWGKKDTIITTEMVSNALISCH